MAHRPTKIILLAAALTIGLAGAAAVAQNAQPQPGAANQQAAPQQAAPDAQQQGPKKTSSMSLLQLLVSGGVMMIPIALCSVIAVTVAIERFISLRRGKVIPPEFIANLREELRRNGDDIRAGIAYCDRTRSTIGEIFKAGIERMPYGHETVEKAIEDAGQREVGKMKRRLRPISSVANIAPLLGLLGTIYGMIGAFQATAAHTGPGKSEQLAEGIYMALVTTAAGLTLAVPTLIVYQVLASRIDGMVDEIDERAMEFVEYTMTAQPSDSGDAAAQAAAPGQQQTPAAAPAATAAQPAAQPS